MARPRGDVGVAEQDAAARRPIHAGNGANQCGLAGTVRTDDGNDIAGRNFERNRIERLRVAVKDIEIFDAQHHAAPSSICAWPR